jgi:hypothetical protein
MLAYCTTKTEIKTTDMIVDVPEHFFRGDDQLCHLPHRLVHVSLLLYGTRHCRPTLTVSKSIEVNLKSLRKNGGSRILLLRWAMVILEKDLV